jgi:CubicO group peptidase (beta-lactamase class C family)
MFRIEEAPKGPPEITIADVDRAISGGILGGQKIYSAAAAIASKQGAIFHRGVYGQLNWETVPKRTTFDSLFDISSLTKPLATGLAVMQLVAKGRLALDKPVSQFLKDASFAPWDKILLEHLLDHTSGLVSHRPFWEPLKKDQEDTGVKLLATRAGEARIREAVLRLPPQRPVGEASIYSDLNFMILGWVVESIVGKRLNQHVQNEIYKPLGLNNLFFMDLTDDKRPHGKRAFVATEHSQWRRKTLIGEVHDPNAWAMGGVAGHAGLFATVDDVHRLGQLLLDSYLGKPDAPFHTATVRRFFTRSKRTVNKTWALGWDTPSPRDSLAGSRMSRSSVGHFGFTGCSIWIDLQHEGVTVLLTNRAHPTPDGKDDFMRKLRPHVEDLFAGYAQSWKPPVSEEAEDPYAVARKLNEQKKKAALPSTPPPKTLAKKDGQS